MVYFYVYVIVIDCCCWRYINMFDLKYIELLKFLVFKGKGKNFLYFIYVWGVWMLKKRYFNWFVFNSMIWL